MSEQEWTSVGSKKGKKSSKKTSAKISAPSFFDNVVQSQSDDGSVTTFEQMMRCGEYNKRFQVTEELSNKFDKINAMFSTSTQYKENKRSVNYNQINHNKWENLTLDDCDNAMRIVSKMSIETYKKNLHLFDSQSIESHELMCKFANNLFRQCLSMTQSIDMIIDIIYYLITKREWICSDMNGNVYTLRQVFVTECEVYFDNMLKETIELGASLTPGTMTEYKNFLLVINKLYSMHIISNQVIRKSMSDIELEFETSECINLLTFWCKLYKIVHETWNLKYRGYIEIANEYIQGKYDKIPFATKIEMESYDISKN